MMSPESVTSAMPPNNECGEEEGWSGDNEREQDGKEVTEICEDRVEEPKEGMTFDTSEDAYLFYCRYAKENGFSVSKRTSRKGSDGKLKDITLSCSRTGKARVKTSNPVKPRPQSRMNCPAHIRVVNRDGKFNLNRVVLDHNHEQSPGKARYFKSNRVLDEHGRLRNVFWADARSRAACKEFGDVVTFDTTYLVNKHDMPFAPFVGINHHGQSTLLGCGLISKEDTEPFSWLFQTWITCMWGCAPKAIITDQWFITKYELESNTWLEGLYSERKRWVLAYLKDVFWAGMSSTQRSEGINAYFDGYIHSKTTLKQFVEQYENALASKVESENLEDVKSWSTYIPCITKGELEKQFQSVYTHAKVKEFQEQFVGKLDCLCSKTKEGDIVSEYEFRGMVCTHQLMVWHQMGVQRVPDKYVLRRWCKNVKRVHTKVRICYDKSSTSIEARRHDNMCNLFNNVADLAEESQDKYDMVMTRVRELKQELMEAAVVVESNVVSLGDGMSIQENDSFSLGDGVIPSKRSTNILDPEGRQRKGRPSTKRRISVIEKVIKKKRQTKKKLLSNEQYKEVEEISFGHDIGTQFEKVDYILSHSSYMGHLMWPNMMPHNTPPNMAQGESPVAFAILTVVAVL
ncbi:hypothetical protein Acr_00g0067080 [Actinidia rufa]|uniref:Protein FAR1-RELATED SEQUENCE n=1 Tax=Actinidia rufa TaxID=165716 RepID=A0A7J0DQU1_9ERIC|nr:hypothetical protein Acr_00g0067080 [Actinidia rufa]